MRRILLVLLAACPFLTDACLAQANAINIYCGACRDAHEFPDDFANFAFNQIYGPEGWLPPRLADDFFVTNAAGQTVYVDADYVLAGFDFEGFRIPFWPRNLLQLTMALPNGKVLVVIRSVFQTSLPVPSSPGVGNSGPTDEQSDGADSADGGDGDDEEDYDFYYEEELDWEDIEIDTHEGNVWIEDPDEHGDFDDAEWCEEC